MNYDHSYHAGNFVDVTKHLVLLAVLQARHAAAGLRYLDTHAGAGRYALDSSAARRSGEARQGVLALAQASGTPPPLGQHFLAGLEHDNAGRLRSYPGSPQWAARVLGDARRLQLCERVTAVADRLRKVLPRARVHVEDGYGWLPGALDSRPAVVLIDPPYEQRDELQRAIDCLARSLPRAPQTTFLLWYPLKADGIEARLLRLWRAAGLGGGLRVECRAVPPDHPPGLHGGGLCLLNPPEGLRAALDPTLRWAVSAMAGPLGSVNWPAIQPRDSGRRG